MGQCEGHAAFMLTSFESDYMIRSMKLGSLQCRDNGYIRIQLHSCRPGTLEEAMNVAMKLDCVRYATPSLCFNVQGLKDSYKCSLWTFKEVKIE